MFHRFAIFAVFCSFLASCGSGSNTLKTDFDRTLLLNNIAEEIILPNSKTANEKTQALKEAVYAFVEKPELGGLLDAQNAWKEAYLASMGITAFNFGPGENGLVGDLVSNIATFPVDEAAIEQRIKDKNVNFNDFKRDTRGFLALEYLLFDLLSDNRRIFEGFRTDPARAAYARALADHLQDNLKKFDSGWASYKPDFVKNNGTSAGSSISLLYNEFVRSYEAIKNFKVALPLGKRPGQTAPVPKLTEAYYSGFSNQLIKKHIELIEGIWKGTKKDGTDGTGFDDYLLNVEGGKALVELTLQQQGLLKISVDANLPNDKRLTELIKNEPANVEKVLIELQKGIRFYKSDMSSLLGISITYTSGDGD